MVAHTNNQHISSTFTIPCNDIPCPHFIQSWFVLDYVCLLCIRIHKTFFFHYAHRWHNRIQCVLGHSWRRVATGNYHRSVPAASPHLTVGGPPPHWHLSNRQTGGLNAAPSPSHSADTPAFEKFNILAPRVWSSLRYSVSNGRPCTGSDGSSSLYFFFF